ncbi:MAG: HEAT repeat domain-containing protein [Gammaproteobacteria bacterium]|nr:HEAT repeat domain-containing protein [Gammaproteobacteria bacterium]
MIDSAFLLDDAQMQQFIVDGYITVRADYPPEFHDRIYQEIETVFEHEGNIGNNILPRIPQLQKVFDYPAVRGALTSLLGEGYIMNPHRHCHLNPPGGKGQHWHKDCYVFDHNIRHPRFHWVMAFYYPQDTTEDMGPTAILPRKQAYKTVSHTDPQHASEQALPLCGEAGTVMLVHFDSWHRATPNRSTRKRYMLKFQFARMQHPQAPSWNHENRVWQPVANDANPAVSMDVWNWLCGSTSLPGTDVEISQPAQNGELAHLKAALRDGDEKVRGEAAAALGAMGMVAKDAAPNLVEALHDESETVRLNAAYALGNIGESVVPVLIDAMCEETLTAIAETTAKTPDNAHGTNPTAGYAAQALSVVGSPAVPALVSVLDHAHWWIRAMAVDVLMKIGPPAKAAVRALMERFNDEHWWVRRNAIEALGVIVPSSPDAIPLLIEGLGDADYRVRRNAAITLAKFGQCAEKAIPALVSALDDEDRYNRFYAASALRPIGTPTAQDALVDALFAARWCPITTRDNRY